MKTGQSPVDYWTIAHFSFWWVVGSTLAATGANRLNSYYACLLVACIWEIFERYAEVRWPQYWQSPESAWNIVADILMCVIGVWVSWWGYDHWRP